jgi:ubiquinone biosynthesis protein
MDRQCGFATARESRQRMIFQRFRQIGAAYHQAQRAREIIGVLLKYGYDDIARRLYLPSPSRLPLRSLREQQAALAQLTPPQRLRRALEELGPTFVKLGQLLASRTRVLPPEFTDELAQLQDNVAPISFEAVRTVLEEELKQPPEKIFATIQTQPLGSASIGQVHRATLLSGEEVVVKVQRPGIVKKVREDLGILRNLARLAETHLPEWRLHRPVALVNELATSLERELDFTREAAHIERFSWQFRDEPTIYVPEVQVALTTERLIVMEFIEGIKASNLTKLEAAGINRAEVGKRVADLVMKQIFQHGFFHADPHPGNIHILADQRVCFLDFGMMGFLDQRTREAFVDLVWGIVRRNESSVASALLRLTESDVEPSRSLFETDVAEFMHQHFYRPVGEIQFASLVKNLVQLTNKHRLRLPPDLVVMLKALSMTEELVRRLNPNHDLVGQAAPFMKQTRLERLKPRRMVENLLEFGRDSAETIRDLPREVRRIMSIIRSGEARVNFHHEGLEPAMNAFERSTNRLSFAIVVGTLIISSSLIIRAEVPPIWNGVSVVGLLGYVLAGFLSLLLLLAILRHGKM